MFPSCLGLLTSIKEIHDAGVKTLCGATESHLVLACLPEDTEPEEMVKKLREAGVMVKGDNMLTSDDGRTYVEFLG